MIVVATEDFELYHDAVSELRDRRVEFTTVEPGAALPEGTEVVLSGPDDDVDPEGAAHVAVRDPPDDGAGDDAGDDDAGDDESSADDDAGDDESTADDGAGDGEAAADDGPAGDDGAVRRAVETALRVLREGEGRIVVGVDPGDSPGVAVLAGETVVAAFRVPAREVPSVVRREVADAADPLVRVGDGARLASAQVVERLDDVPVELVDETGTTPYLGTGARGTGDVLAAVNIARRDGERVDGRAVEPTDGELQAIKNRSRERSAEGRTIDEQLARRVAAGDLTIEEALAEHRGDR